MTVIVATRDAMYSDSICASGDSNFPSLKIYRHKGELIGTAGDVPGIEKFLKWYTGNRKKPVDFGDHTFSAIVVNKAGIWDYSGCTFPDYVMRDYHGCGIGWQAAHAAMLCGETPERAVEIACKVTHLCGLPVQKFTLRKN